ncbi:Lrp/AsnC family transcriptional regulator [Actinomycetospora sp. CA-084318]|uniref:Lrp/AsnC family transcriptional regulator n=1 Tax=Actinomycetospora sp. CA-084318 TaxID=3239892 RepID=UPI003D99AF18
MSLETSGPCALAPDDLRILRALQLAPRAPFATIAAVLGLSEASLSRRHGRMRRAGVLHVAGVVDPGAFGQTQWLVRLRCRPGSAAAIAESLALRGDVGWVALSAAGTEVTCVVRSRSTEAREDLLEKRLPRTAAVLDLEVAVLMRKFAGGRGEYRTVFDGVLTPEQEVALGGVDEAVVEKSAVSDVGPLQDGDEALLDALVRDGRASHVDLASATGLTPGRAARRLADLVGRRVVHFHLELAPAALGLDVGANLWLHVHPSQVRAVGRALAALPQVGFALAVSGRTNLHALVHCHDVDELFELTSDRVGSLPGVDGVEVSPVLRHVKQSGALSIGRRLKTA